jgi:hypothetical protein
LNAYERDKYRIYLHRLKFCINRFAACSRPFICAALQASSISVDNTFAHQPRSVQALIVFSMHDHESDDGTASEKDAVEVVVLQTAASWRGTHNQPRIRRSVAGEQLLAQATGVSHAQMPWVPAVKLPAAAAGKQRADLQQLVMVVVACITWCVHIMQCTV